MKNKIRNLLFIVFLCLFVFPFIYYFIQSIEGFTEKSSYGQWELVLRQSYNDQFYKSPFNGNVSVNINALYDEDGHINETNYYNSSLYSNYDFSTNRLLKLNYYDTYESLTPSTITWSQDISTVPTVISDTTLPTDFKGLIQSTDSSYVFIGYSEDTTQKYILGASQAYLADVSYITGYPTAVEKVELYLWNPRPSNKNTFNGNYKQLKVTKVDMNDTTHKHFWNKTQDLSGIMDATDNRFSYCFGKLRCNDNMYSPIENSKGHYKPYCNSDSSLNPVYCEGSALYNAGTTFNPVAIGTLSFDTMGKYASYGVSNEDAFNLFRGLTTPYSNDYIDPEISGNDVITYDAETSTFVKNNICNFLDNKNLINGTNLQEECEESRYTGTFTDLGNTFTEISGNKCIANYGDTINSKYKNYVCKENEACVGYECGVKFGNCAPSLL